MIVWIGVTHTEKMKIIKKNTELRILQNNEKEEKKLKFIFHKMWWCWWCALGLLTVAPPIFTGNLYKTQIFVLNRTTPEIYRLKWI